MYFYHWNKEKGYLKINPKCSFSLWACMAGVRLWLTAELAGTKTHNAKENETAAQAGGDNSPFLGKLISVGLK